MTLKDIIKAPVISVHQDATMCEAVGLLSSTGTSELPVVDTAGDLVGILSEVDIMRLLMPTYQDLTSTDAALLDPTLMQDRALEVRNNPICTIMTKNVISLAEGDSVLKAASIMISRKLRIIPVVRSGKPVGTVSRMDVLHAVLQGGR